ncbi:MAG: DUF6607 family protein [Pseudomonadota bacterium]
MTIHPKYPLLIITVLALNACASRQTAPAPASTQPADPSFVANPHFGAIADATDKASKDKAAILAMGGDYRVSFEFMETVALQAGYEHKDKKTSGAYETVVVVENKPSRVVLQHMLVMPGGHVIKHWRQDWIYEATERFEFVADQTWKTQPLEPSETEGRWTQCVFEVSDAPRYCGTGAWNHSHGVSTWTSDRSWRPLPRREYTTRSDYNALNVENRHTVTPNGWTHEQDNTKIVRDGTETRHTLVREFGFNNYRNIEGYDFSPATAYWERTAAFWERVRTAWSARFDATEPLVIHTAVDGMPIIQGTFEMAEQVADLAPEAQVDRIEQLLNTYVTPAKGESEDRVAAAPSNSPDY